MVRENELPALKAYSFVVTFQALPFCDLEKMTWIFSHITYSLQILRDVHHCSECKHVKCLALIQGYQYVLNIQVDTSCLFT
jgi:hypothetical protein